MGMNITICIGSSCHLKGSRAVVEKLEQLILEHGSKQEIALSGSFCMGQCQSGVNVTIDEVRYSVTPETVEEFFNENIKDKA